jgi:hypothetical protein
MLTAKYCLNIKGIIIDKRPIKSIQKLNPIYCLSNTLLSLINNPYR